MRMKIQVSLVCGESFVVVAETTESSQPCERSFDDPAFRLDDVALEANRMQQGCSSQPKVCFVYSSKPLRPYTASAKTTFNRRQTLCSFRNTHGAPSCSGTDAACATTVYTHPSVSKVSCRLRPSRFFPLSSSCSSPLSIVEAV